MMTRLGLASACVALSVLCACGGGGATPPLSGTTSGGTAAQDFSGLSTTPMAVGDSRVFTPNESGYGGTYSAGSAAPSVVSVNPASGTGPFTAKAQGPGSATITVADQNGHSSAVTIPVGTVGFGALSSAPFAVGERRAFTPSEAAYGGAFTATSSDPATLAVAPGTGAGPFTVTAMKAGQATITVADQNGHQASSLLTVSGSGSGPTAAPTAAPSSAPTATPSSAPTAGPTSTPTASPAPAIALSQSSLTIPWAGTGSVSATDASGTVSASVANPTVATIVSAGGGYLISGNAPGSTTITFSDAAGHTAQLPVTVPPAPAPAISLNATGITQGQAQIGVDAVELAPTETGYSGSFTGTLTTNAIATLTQLPNNTFAVTTADQGSSIVTVRDTNGNSASAGFTAQ